MLDTRRLISLAAKRYAQTFFAQAKKDGEVDKLLTSWLRMAEAMEQEPGIAAYLRDPGMSVQSKMRFLAKVYRKEPPQGFLAGMQMLLEAQRYELFAEMAAALQQIIDEDQGVMRVLVRSAHPVNAEQLHRLEKLIQSQEKKEPVIATEIDASLIGGLQVQLDHRVIDASVKQFIESVGQHLRSVTVH